MASTPLQVQNADIGDLKPHPKNYREHPKDQLDHIVASIREHGFYRNVVVARDNTILAGHGVVKASQELGLKQVPIIRLDIAPNSPKALKVLAGDNEIAKRAIVDDRGLTDMLKSIMEEDDLMGTGFDEAQLAALAMVTRPASEIADINEAAEWAGMPAYEEGGTPLKLVVTFKTEEDRKAFTDKVGLRVDKIAGATWSTRWPWTEREDVAGIRFETTP